ncbi:deoxynucleoside kinase [Mycoplasma mycoides subsp. mycoides]|uniref:Deoxyguanosine kinase n=3 Tax=Mycoplasma mycoides subsp. mycoides TaxID=2103 RepID=Q6MTL5_MYCMS|nr:deoxynucleoside kinase [Mycoplasma mycoides]2JAQ_A Chain A, Deoxyguanosine Kinase [Mycoplasma mycoides subsp. mycoides SC]2JAQ_B Chain B, Deoxyguanosine Kinase [Mycoplasma mycoides subsp. mycoides SC]2JAT_A Chain A, DEOXYGUANOSINE KINASE [Mycoplasma mycoides subsp. mycoides SC]2JAT_B Chain B, DEOXYGUANOSINE KINASE [Mycoplasma mycoides subsp. mycoides SC]CAE77021.1 deoxyguanosine kinase [Mycoplasma mycoides subsp. mycoides SC str. PG1]ADK69614.1 deoxynucleoside kinase [Mycoplasma mycoides s
MKIAIFGTVGAGKSTISAEISKKLGYEIFKEPVEENPYFEQYYKDLKKTVFKMQIYMLTARSKQLKQAKNLENIIFDRTLLEDPIFMKVNYDLNNVDQTDYNTYIDFYNNVVLENLKIPENKLSFDIVIYLRVSTKTAISRIKKRGRSEELLIGEEYWETLNKNYEEFYKQNVYDFPFFVVDAELDVKTQIELIMNKLNSIKNPN